MGKHWERRRQKGSKNSNRVHLLNHLPALLRGLRRSSLDGCFLFFFFFFQGTSFLIAVGEVLSSLWEELGCFDSNLWSSFVSSQSITSCSIMQCLMALAPPKLGYFLTWQLHRNLWSVFPEERYVPHTSYRIKPIIFNPLVRHWKWEYLWEKDWSIQKALKAKAGKLGYRDDLKYKKTAPKGLTTRILIMCLSAIPLPSLPSTSLSCDLKMSSSLWDRFQPWNKAG